MKEYKKYEVLDKLTAAFEAGVNKARLMERHGLHYDDPVRSEWGNFIHPQYEELNEAYTVFMKYRQEFVFMIRRYYAERRQEVPAELMEVFNVFMNKLMGPFDEEMWRADFRAVIGEAEEMIREDEQLEFDF